MQICSKMKGWGTVTKDCDYVHHVAAPISLDVPKDPDAFIPAAVDGTLRVLNAASKNNIKRVVATSTLGAMVKKQTKKKFLMMEIGQTQIIRE